MTLNESAWLEANFICYGCASWTPRPVESTVQHWIWAYNSVQRMERASEQSTLAAHENWGVFDMDINGQWDNPPNRAVIHTGPEKASSSWAGLHGSILAVSIMLLYPCGAFAMWGKSGNALKTHLFQIPASIGCFVGGAIAVYATAKNGPVSAFPGFRAHTSPFYIYTKNRLVSENLMSYSARHFCSSMVFSWRLAISITKLLNYREGHHG